MKADSKPRQSIPSSAEKPQASATATLVPAALTRVDPEWGGLPARQRTALMALATGRGYAEAAQAAGVSRQTLHVWRKKDTRFAAIYNSWQNQMLASAQNRLVSLTNNAVTAVADAIDAGDTRTSLELLRGLGLLVPPRPGSEDAAEIQRQLDLAHREQQSKTAHREAMLRADKAMIKMLP
jgi:transposase-like protein